VIDGRSVLAVIPARGGSKGLPGKNIRSLAGKPLVAWTIEAAKSSKFIDRVVLSSDDDAIMQVALEWGCDVPFTRDAELATDEATSVDVLLDALRRVPGYDWVVLLQPTSPLRTALDIDNCLRESIESQSRVGLSVCEAPKSPYWMYRRSADGRLHSLFESTDLVTRRQALPIVHQLNGAVYVAESQWLVQNRTFLTPETYAYVMPKSRSVDVDDELDLLYAGQLIANYDLLGDQVRQSSPASGES